MLWATQHGTVRTAPHCTARPRARLETALWHRTSSLQRQSALTNILRKRKKTVATKSSGCRDKQRRCATRNISKVAYAFPSELHFGKHVQLSNVNAFWLLQVCTLLFVRLFARACKRCSCKCYVALRLFFQQLFSETPSINKQTLHPLKHLETRQSELQNNDSI